MSCCRNGVAEWWMGNDSLLNTVKLGGVAREGRAGADSLPQIHSKKPMKFAENSIFPFPLSEQHSSFTHPPT